MRLVERAGGNPFFLEELTATGVAVSETSGPLRDLLLRRARDLPADVLRLLRITSAGGTTIDEQLVSQVAGLEMDEARGLLRIGIEAQLLTLDDRSCRFRHALVAEALHDDLLPAERREYHAAYADALGSRAVPAPPAELANHQERAGRVQEALAAWVAAATAAEQQFAFAEAFHSLHAALDLLDGSRVEVAGTSRLDLRHRMAEAAFLAGDVQAACETARELLDEIDPTGDPIAAGMIHHRLARYLCDTPDHGDAMAIQRRALELIPASPPSPQRAEVVAGLARILQYEVRYPEARDRSIEAIELAELTGAVHVASKARNTLGNAVCLLDDVDRGLAIIGEALESSREAHDAHEQARSIWNISAHVFGAARWEEVVQGAEARLTALRRLQPSWVPELMLTVADALVRLARWDEAQSMIDVARREDPTQAEVLGLPELLVARGEIAPARTLLAAKRAFGVASDVEGHLWTVVNLAEIEVADGRFPEALRAVDEVLARSAGLDMPIALGYALAVGLRAAADLAGLARIKRRAGVVDSALRAGRRYHERMVALLGGPGARNGWKREVGALGVQCDAELARLDGRHDASLWTRAAEQWDTLEMPYHAAYGRYRWSEVAMTSGLLGRDEVAPVLVDLVTFLDRLGAKPLAGDVRRLARRARIDLGDGPRTDRFGLTAREREVLEHVARGSTNRQIADTLYITDKTASVHVSNILRKLGAANRGEAAATAISEGLVGVAELGARP